MNSLQSERFARLQFPVHKITAKTPVELFEILPGLRRYFQKLSLTKIDVVDRAVDKKLQVEGYEGSYKGMYPEDLVRIIKYIVFVYDPDSDLIGEYPNDPRLLREAAAKEAGFRRTQDGEWPEYVQDILDFKEKQVVAWIMDYLKVKKNPIFTEIRFIEEELESLYRRRANALLRGEVEATAMQLIKQRIDERDNLYKRFYAEHTDLKKATQDELYPVSPENVFKELKIPREFSRVRQVRDVSQNAGVQEAHN